MIITKEIKKLVTQYNLRIFKKFGYSIGNIAIVKMENWDKNSHEKIEVSCDICNLRRNLPYREYIRSFNNYGIYCCSSKCSQFKNKLTKKENYNDENYSNRGKYKKTCLQNYGVDNTFKSKEIIKKIDIIKREKYGNKLEKIVFKMKEAMLVKYGVDNISKLDDIKDIKKRTTFKNYGVEYPSQSYELREKSKSTCIQRYGFEYPIQSNIIKNKIKKYNLKRYGVEWFVLSNEYLLKIKEIYGIEINFPLDLLKRWKNTDDYKNRKCDIYEKIKISNIKNGK